MSYSRNFGMRSFENIVRNGRFRAPKSGDPIVIGAPVILDPATPGFFKAATAAAAPNAAAGIALYEHIQAKGVDTSLVSTHDAPFNQVPAGQYAQIIHGKGAKVWFKNTADKTLYDGRTQKGGSLIATALGSLTIGAGLVPDGLGKFKVAGAGEAAWLTIEQINTSTGLVEARFEF